MHARELYGAAQAWRIACSRSTWASGPVRHARVAWLRCRLGRLRTANPPAAGVLQAFWVGGHANRWEYFVAGEPIEQMSDAADEVAPIPTPPLSPPLLFGRARPPQPRSCPVRTTHRAVIAGGLRRARHFELLLPVTDGRCHHQPSVQAYGVHEPGVTAVQVDRTPVG